VAQRDRIESRQGPGMSDLLLAVGVACLVDKAQKRQEDSANIGEKSPHNTEVDIERLEQASESKTGENLVPVEELVPAPAAPPPEFYPCLLFQRDPSAKARRTSTLAASAMLHGAMLAGFAAATSSMDESVIAPKYKIEILHLQQAHRPGMTPITWIPLREQNAQTPGRKTRGVAGSSPNASARRNADQQAQQTLVVDRAPREAQLDEPIPLPMEVALSAAALPANTTEVRIEGASEPAIDLLHTPAVRIESLPAVDEEAPEAAMIPRVNQTAAPGREDAAARKSDVNPAGSGAGIGTNTPGPQAASSAKPVAPRTLSSGGGTILAPDEPVRLPNPQTAGAETWNENANAAKTPVSENPRSSSSRPESVTRIDVLTTKPRIQITAESLHIPGKVVATVYLNMQLPKTWALEYWVNGDGLTGVTPPWPSTMYRPEITLPKNTDTLLIRARLTADGCIENAEFLTKGVPAELTGTLRALENWRFRPAMRAGQPIAVEILLVIPRQDGQ